MKKVILLIKKYLPDILILLGILTFSYNLLRPQVFCRFGKDSCDLLGYGYVADHHIGDKVLGIMPVFNRHYFSYKTLFSF